MRAGLGASRRLAVPFPELVLEVGNVELIGELVQVRERSGGDSLREDRDTLGMRIERAVHVGAHGKQALHVRDEVLGLLRNSLECSARFSCLDRGY